MIAKGQLVAGTGIEEILGDTSIYPAGLKIAAVNVNHIHKSRYSVWLSALPIYVSLNSHGAINSVLLLYSWAEERSSSSRMFKYWIVIMKFQIDYLAFIRFMREGNFKPCNKIVMSVVKLFFIFDQCNYVRWLSVYIEDLLSLPITCPKLNQGFEGGNFVVQILGSQFSQIHYEQSNNKAIKYIKGSIDFMNCASDELQRRWGSQDPKLSNT